MGLYPSSESSVEKHSIYFVALAIKFDPSQKNSSAQLTSVGGRPGPQQSETKARSSDWLSLGSRCGLLAVLEV